VITRHGRPVARVLPTVPGAGIPSRAELRRKMRRVEVGSEVLIREDRDARG
jgi:antitoxin (DNA-binding transcriptional repressor) of toxin-antitoxin stability system